MKKLMLFCTLLLVIGSSYSMGKDSGTLSLSANAHAISNGISTMLNDSAPLNSSLFLMGWHNATSRHGIFDTGSLKDPQVAGAIVAGVIGSAVKATITEESYKKLPNPIKPVVKVVLKHPFLVAYTGLHAWYRLNEIKSNPWPFVAETCVLGIHLYNNLDY